MDKLSVKLENCYGIGKFENIFDFSKTNSFLIYAPNGTMKTSFAKTFKDISKKTKPSDLAYPNRKTTCDILSGEQAIEPDVIFIADAENNFDATDKISSFIASKELKRQYDLIYFELDKSKNEFIKRLKAISQSTDCETELLTTFSKNSNDTLFTIFLSLTEELTSKHEKYNFRYNDIFDKKGNVEKFLGKNKTLLNQYFNNYQNLLASSKFFKKSDNSFGTVQANGIIDSIKDNAFFEAGHKFVLSDNSDITSVDVLKELVQSEINNIINDEKLKESFDKVDKAIGGNVELRAFKDAIEKDHLLLVPLQNYDEFRRKVWLGYLYELKEDVANLTDLYNAKKAELEKLLLEAKKELNIWKNIVTVFNSRFYIPFAVEIANQEDIILKLETANLVFKYKDKVDEEPIPQQKDALLKILSKGEQRAYYILQLLFDVEARKLQEKPSLLIFDDIADSFDYKNKYAIIEYIRDLQETDKFKLIILTHNFDFYRTISSRLDLGNSVYMAVKDTNREVKLLPGQYRKDVFLKHFIPKCNQTEIFISLIPFVRNIIDYSEGSGCDNYKTLTSCLHLKADSGTITGDAILNILNTKLNRNATIDFGAKNIIELIFETAQGINKGNINEILLENKIVLSIATRLKAEMFMIKLLPNINLEEITSNQTRELFKKYKESYPDNPNLRILDKVNLMTPENIHINAFMYEPLIDMSVKHLIDLYNEVVNLQ